MKSFFVLLILVLCALCYDQKPSTRFYVNTAGVARETAFPMSIEASTNDWKKRTIYQVLTDRFACTDGCSCGSEGLHNYCGGTWKGITANLDYISGMGFDAVWISPIIENVDGGYHGYWAKNIYNLNSHFGTEEDLLELSRELHSRGMYLMLDVVGNHMGIDPTGFRNLVPFNQTSYYHPRCDITDWNNQHMVEVCWLAGLPDLDQSVPYVHDHLCSWIQNLVKKFGIDGLRIDTAREVPKNFWVDFQAAANCYTVGEDEDGDIDRVAGYQGPQALTGVLNYPLYYSAVNGFASGNSLFDIQNTLTEENKVFQDIQALGLFSDNHDNPRFLSKNSDWNRLKNYLVFNFFAEGIPILYYGTEQGYAGGNDPANRETLFSNMNPDHLLYKYVKLLITVRKAEAIPSLTQVQRYADDNFYAFTRDHVFVATTNVGSGNECTRTITYHPYKDGTKLCNQLDQSYCTSVSGGKLTITLSNGLPMVLIPQ